MRPVKILHCADFHFDTPFSGLSGSTAEKRKEDLRETFGRTVSLAKREGVDLMLVGGDLFDNGRVSPLTVEYLMEQLGQIPQVRVFIAPGNHDPYHEESYYHLVSWPSNVHIFKNNTEKVEIEELETCVYGWGFAGSHQCESSLRGFAAEDPAKLNIMVVHGDVVPAGQGSDYNPLSFEDIRASGLDYLALGHRHSFTGVKRLGETFWVYSGCPEGRAFDEPGDRGILLGELGKGFCSVEYRSICKRKYLELKIDISPCKTYEEIGTTILERAAALEPSRNLFKVVLTGEIPEDFLLHTAVIKEKLEKEFYYLQVEDETATRVDTELLANDFSLRGLFVKKALQRISLSQDQGERRKAELALKYGLRLLERGEAGIE